MCMNAELQVLNAGLMQSGGQSGMRPAVSGQGMQCQRQVGSTESARRAALAQQPGLENPIATGRKISRPLFCLGNYALDKR